MGHPISGIGVETPGGLMATAVLLGGPDTLPDELRKCRVMLPCEKVKIAHDGGYEHFASAAGDSFTDAELIFEWVTRTRVAE
jgi:hypothetical protein